MGGADRQEEGEEIENQIANHGQHLDEAAVRRQHRHPRQVLDVGNQGDNGLEHAAADQNRQGGCKNSRDRLNHRADLVFGLFGGLVLHTAVGDVDLLGNFFKDGVDLGADHHLHLAALDLGRDDPVQAFQGVEICFAVVFQIEA